MRQYGPQPLEEKRSSVMVHQDDGAAIMWREGTHRCELWRIGGVGELRVYVSDLLTCRERVREGTGGLQQAAKLLMAAQDSIRAGAR
jgi:hypothetical protein